MAALYCMDSAIIYYLAIINIILLQVNPWYSVFWTLLIYFCRIVSFVKTRIQGDVLLMPSPSLKKPYVLLVCIMGCFLLIKNLLFYWSKMSLKLLFSKVIRLQISGEEPSFYIFFKVCMNIIWKLQQKCRYNLILWMTGPSLMQFFPVFASNFCCNSVVHKLIFNLVVSDDN